MAVEDQSNPMFLYSPFSPPFSPVSHYPPSTSLLHYLSLPVLGSTISFLPTKSLITRIESIISRCKPQAAHGSPSCFVVLPFLSPLMSGLVFFLSLFPPLNIPASDPCTESLPKELNVWIVVKQP
jgi:hypothetical protein